MVFCLCFRKGCFSKTLVISSNTNYVDKNFNTGSIVTHSDIRPRNRGNQNGTAAVVLPTPSKSNKNEVTSMQQTSSSADHQGIKGETPVMGRHDLTQDLTNKISDVQGNDEYVHSNSTTNISQNTQLYQEDIYSIQPTEHIFSPRVEHFSPKVEHADILTLSSPQEEEIYASEVPNYNSEKARVIQKGTSHELISSNVAMSPNQETNKVKSALKKIRAPPIPVAERSVSPSPAVKSNTDQNDENIDNSETNSSYDQNISPKESLDFDTPKPSIGAENVPEERREGVAPIPVRIDQNLQDKLPVFIKDPSDQALIRKAIKSNDFLHKVISGEQLKDVIAAMYNKEVSAKEVIIKQGDKGQHMYVSAKGNFQVVVNGKTVSQFSDVRVFGELAILYNAKRLATVKALTSGRVWVLDSTVYQQIMLRRNLKNEEEVNTFLLNNEILNVVGQEALQVVSTLLKTEFFPTGSVIVKQGDRGDKFYIIRAGTVTISKEGEGTVGVYKKGDCFGELALLEEDCRQATVTANSPGVECLTLTRKEFVDNFGEVKKFKYIKVKDKPKDSIRSIHAEYDDINLFDLKIIKTLGVGGFGRVELVQHTKDENIVFALKYLKKIEIVQQNQQEHVFNEKRIQMAARSPFIVRLYRTYRDSKYIYFLMESCLGGDLWSLLQRKRNKRFDEKEARFICACVLLAFEYLHARGIIYRDLKPENLLLAVNGYIKLTDFGFAKKIPDRGKTYTFAGTPEYVAPEIILNRGHDRAADYWAFGAFVFEMLSGKTPFKTDDSSHMKTYNKILGGIGNVAFPNYIELKARHLVEKLCRPVPSERLGMQKNGIQDIKNHKWFLGMDWQRLQKMDHTSPFKPKLAGPTDTKYFDQFKKDNDNTPDELSGWDEGF